MFSSCAKNLVVNYANPSPNSGNIVIKPSSQIRVNLTVNDSLILDDKFVKKITIMNVPSGTNSIHLSANSENLKQGIDFKSDVIVTSGKTNSKLITVPPKSNGYYINEGITYLGFITWLALILSNP